MDGDGELRLSIMATMAQEESRKISERVLAGQKISRQNGVLYGSGNIIGYDRDKVNRTYVINEEQAATIRMVFTLYSQGYGEKAIVNELSRLGRKDGHGNVSWSCTKISRILRNATYMGYVCYNKSKVNNYLEKKRINNLDETSFVYVKATLSRSYQKPSGMNVSASVKAVLSICVFLMEKHDARALTAPNIYGSQNFVAAAVLPTAFSTGAN